MAARAKSPATLGEWLAHAIKLYAKHDSALGQVATSAHDEALYLLLHTLGLPMDSKPVVLKKKLTAEETARVAEVFRLRLEEHVPAAYLTREAWLGEHRFYVDERVIIPRSYFLELLPEQIPQWLPANKPVKRVVDVCTGSGCLAILLAHQFPDAKVDAVELSTDALAVAKFNVAEHGLAKRVKLFHSDVLEAVPVAKYDLILSNPPYVPTRELRDLPEEFKNEPQMALDGGKDGLDIVRRLLRQSRERLQPHGIVALEVGQAKPALDQAFPELDPHWLHTEDGEDCVCVIQAARLVNWKG
ncbi:50S ribosomal protein L3 N(5)-glutamine methyltransferase [Oleiharenicola lentus]|uniref:50S ribosomal protein L3 N(5)-glutamine methyltransferase n=1 Tax=Oleiharenicola lentus TaxID=2508720 RepID=UPI003F6669F4